MPGNRTWPCHIESKQAPMSWGVTHQEPYHRLKFFPLLSSIAPSPPATASSFVFIIWYFFLHIFSSFHCHRKNNVCFGAINAGMMFPFFAMHIVYEYLKVTGSIYRPDPPLLILSVLFDTCVPRGTPWDSFFLSKEMHGCAAAQDF